MYATIQTLADEFGLTPVMAAEIECYVMLPKLTQTSADWFFEPLADHWKNEGVPILRIEKETGHRQFEIVTTPTTPVILAATLDHIRECIVTRGADQQVRVSFASKRFKDQPSSGMHIHTHLAGADGVNVFHKTEEWTSDALRWSLGGLLADLPASMDIFFPRKRDYARLEDADHVPKIAGWGVNNRYCALRIPAIEDPYDKRIEHRVPCADADPEAVIAAILRGILRGLREKTEPPPQEYGKPTKGLRETLGLLK